MNPSRRAIIVSAAAFAPPVINFGAAAAAAIRLNDFRIRRIDVPIPGLPRELDGLTIAHVSDSHAGRFCRPPKLARIAAAVNGLSPDLVLMTGDLIDFSLDDLPGAIAMLKSMRPKEGLFMCEGNHDLFQSRWAFEESVKSAGIELLLNESATIGIRGKAVQILGTKWGMAANRRNPMLAEHVAAVAELRRPGAFHILLAHHPHAFDHAVEAGFPLMLCGHTHGGQIMPGGQGFGRWLYRYWSGLYTKGTSNLVVSNGVGNWFPLRINAPAEIIHLTLTRREGTPSALLANPFDQFPPLLEA